MDCLDCRARASARIGRLLVVSCFATALTLGPQARAGISGINTPAGSIASIIFDDTFSFDPLLNPGVTLGGPSVSPWNGALVSMPLTTDAVTFDTASGDLDATFAGNAYAINLNNVLLNQAPANTGTAHLTFTFNVEYQLDAFGLPQQPTLYPNFVVDGTVQNIPGSFAALSGWIDYIGVDAAGIYSVVETVTYTAFWGTPGNFNTTVFGAPVNGITPLLPGGSTLTLNGVIVFQVDPATIGAYSVMVPEPSTAMLALVGAAAAMGIWTRRRRRGSQIA